MTQRVVFYSYCDGKERERSDLTAQKEFGESMTVQAMAEDADLNVLMHRYGVTGKMPENPLVPVYGDYSGVRDYRTAWEACRKAEAAFMEFPAQVRARFDNDPQIFLDFCGNPANLPALREMGLARKQENGNVGGTESVQQVGANAGAEAGAAASGVK